MNVVIAADLRGQTARYAKVARMAAESRHAEAVLLCGDLLPEEGQKEFIQNFLDPWFSSTEKKVLYLFGPNDKKDSTMWYTHSRATRLSTSPWNKYFLDIVGIQNIPDDGRPLKDWCVCDDRYFSVPYTSEAWLSTRKIKPQDWPFGIRAVATMEERLTEIQPYPHRDLVCVLYPPMIGELLGKPVPCPHCGQAVDMETVVPGSRAVAKFIKERRPAVVFCFGTPVYSGGLIGNTRCVLLGEETIEYDLVNRCRIK